MKFARIQSALFLVLAMAVLVGMVAKGQDGQSVEADGDPDLSSVKSGNWSDPTLWSDGAVPSTGKSVAINSGHTVVYDVLSEEVLGEVSIQGTLRFSRFTSTRLKTNDNIMVMAGGFLDMGTSAYFIPRDVKAEVIWQLSQDQVNAYKGGPHFEATDKGLWAMSGSRWEVNGAPLLRPWSKLAGDAPAGATSVVVENNVADWPIGGAAVITQTSNPAIPTVDSMGRSTYRFQFENEVRTVSGVEPLEGGKTRVTFDQPLAYPHQGTAPYRGEVGLLSRNVRFETQIEGVDEARLIGNVGARKFAHTMWMNGATGDAQYAEFKFMGNYLKLARYPIHTHMMGDTSGGKVIRGNGIWYTGFRWVTVHSSYGVTVEDNVGFSSTQSGYFGEADFYQDPKFPDSNRFLLEAANKDLAFVHNLGVEATSVRSEDRSRGDFVRHSTFWVASSAGYAFLGNVAVGTRNGRDTGGYLVGEVSFNSAGHMGEHFLKNESHSNKENGFFHWNNRQEAFELVDSLMWRNGGYGMHLGAYTGEFMTYNGKLYGNTRGGVLSNSTDTYVQDGVMTDSPVGWEIGNYFAEQTPEEPHWNVRNTYRNLEVGYSHLHDECNSEGFEIKVRTRECSADYSYLIGNEFSNVETPIDFGWQANANSWHRVADSVGLDSGLPQNFNINRMDQRAAAKQGPESAAIVGDGSNSIENAGLGALVTPIASPWADYPPEVRLEVTMSGKSATLKATATDDKDIPRVEFFVDWVRVASQTAPPYEFTVDLSNHPRKYAYIYARAYDNTAIYRHQTGVDSTGDELKGPYLQRAYSEVIEIGPEVLGIPQGRSGGPADLTPPAVTITTPESGASYAQGQSVLAAFTCSDEAGGSGIASCVGDLAMGAAIDTTNPGAHSFTVTGTDQAGNPTLVIHNYTVAGATTSSSALLEDSFDRPDSAVVGGDWLEVEGQEATVSIANGKLFFDNTSDAPLRPLIRKSFAPVSAGTLRWSFDFDWAKTATDGGYELWMQLGDSSQMLNPTDGGNQFAGVGVNLRWGAFDNTDQNLVARQDASMGGPEALTAISGPTQVSVTVDLGDRTYSVAVDGTEVGSGLNFDDSGTVNKLDTVRFFTNNLIEASFSGRTFDNVAVVVPGQES
jgi:hypothetical protein